MHATDSDVVFVKDKIVGTLSAAVFMDSNLNRDVLNYKPLHIHKKWTQRHKYVYQLQQVSIHS